MSNLNAHYHEMITAIVVMTISNSLDEFEGKAPLNVIWNACRCRVARTSFDKVIDELVLADLISLDSNDMVHQKGKRR